MKRALLLFVMTLSMVLIPVMYLGSQDQPQDQGPPPDQGPYGQQGPPQQYPGPGPAPQDQQQGPPPQDQQQGPPPQPQSAVGRISLIDGNLSTQRGDSGSWVADTVNTPVVPGDQLSTGPHSRAEVELDFADVLRLDHDSVARVANLAQGQIQIQVAQGQVDYSVIRDGGAVPEIDSPNVAVHPAGRGVYRIEVDSPTVTRVTVREGQAQVSTPQGSTNVQPGQTITVQGSDNPEYKIDQAAGHDAWDHWNAERDKTILSAKSWEHTNPYYTGSADLDQYGQWQNVPGYGQVWEPQQGPGWAPYSDGTWVWEPDWGWTWVSYEPWGWAPYHYGRWFMYDNAWMWWPGPVGIGLGFGGWYRPIWAPAYVSFFGFGWGHFGLGFGFGFGGFGFGGGWGWGRVGWLPVGPRDPFYPMWGRGGRFGAVNITNVTNIHNGFIRPLAGVNRPAYGSNLDRAMTDPGVRRGITSMASDHFGQGGVRGQAGAVTADMMRSGSMMSGRMPIAPTRASLSASSRPAAAGTIARGSMSEHFAGTRAPTFNHASFAQQSAAIQRENRSVNPSTVAQESRASAQTPAQTMNRTASSNASRGFGSAGQAANSRTSTSNFGRQSAPQSGATTQGWQRFAGQGGSRGTTSANGFAGARQSFGTQSAPRSSFGSPGRSESNFGSAGSRYYTGQSRPSSGYYTGGSRSYGYGSSRPPLQMNRPMFSPRSAPSYRGSYGRSSGSYSAPRSSGGRTGGERSGGGGHSGGFGGGHASGGGSHGGGGGGHHR
jgi:hypothetical protein